MARPSLTRTPDLARRRFVAGSLAVGALAAARLGSSSESRPAFRNALSVSPFTERVLQQSIKFSDGVLIADTTESMQRMFLAHGGTEVYARLGTLRKVTPGIHDHSVERGLERARLARQLNLPFNPELGLFATYGDVTHQPGPDFSDFPQLSVPAPWHDLRLEQMLPILERYGALIAEEIVATGASVNIWDLGNEVERGVAGVAVPPIVQPDGWKYRAPDKVDREIGKMDLRRYVLMPESDRIEWLSRHLWPYVGALFAAVASGIRSVDRSARFSTHVSGMAAYSAAMLTQFFLSMDAAGFRVDEAGLSYYPSASAEVPDRFAAMKETVSKVATSLKRGVFIAEYAYPVGPFKFGKDDWDHATASYPVSPRGQTELLRDLTTWGRKTGHVTGIRPWAPDLVVPGWGEMSLFDLTGAKATARTSLDAISVGLREADRV